MFETLRDKPDILFAMLMAALFIGLHWAIRGAPFAQTLPEPGPDGDPVSAPDPKTSPDPPRAARIRRREFAAALATLGVILVATGAYLAFSRGVPWSIPAFALGFLALLRAPALVHPDRHDDPHALRVLRASGLGLGVALLGGVLTLFNLVAYRLGARPLDFTSARVNTLSERTLLELRDLDRPLRLTLFHGRDRGALERVEQLTQLLRAYVEANPERVSLERVDSYADRLAFQELYRRHPETGMIQFGVGGGLLVEYGDEPDARSTVLSNVDLFLARNPADIRAPDPDRAVFEFFGEDVVTSAIARLVSGERPLALFTTGHGELPVAIDADPARPRATLFRLRLESQGYRVDNLDLSAADIPDDAALIVVAGPAAPFRADETAKLRRFLEGGGRAILAIDPRVKDEALEALLLEHHVKPAGGPVVEDRARFRNLPSQTLVAVPQRVDHPILEPLAGRTLLLPLSGALDIADARNPAIQTQPILKSSPRSWLESDPAGANPTFEPGKDLPGPFNLAMAVSVGDPLDLRAPVKPRLVLIASPQFPADDALVNSGTLNEQFLLNAAAWLRGESKRLGIEPRTRVAIAFSPDPAVVKRLLWMPTLLALAGYALLAFLVRAARRA